MSETQDYDFRAGDDVHGTFSYDRVESRLSVGIAHRDGTAHTFEFSNIGHSDPIEFMAEMDWGYAREKVFGDGWRTHDFLGSLATVHAILDNPLKNDLELSYDDVRNVRRSVNIVMSMFDGDEEVSCHGLLSTFRAAGIIDDTHHMIRFRESEKATAFREKIWDPFQAALQAHLDSLAPSPFAEEEPDDALEAEEDDLPALM